MKQHSYIRPEYFNHCERDPWRWRGATGNDVEAIIALIDRYFAQDNTGIPVQPLEGARNLMHAIVNQMYDPKTELLSVAYLTETGEIIAVNWAQRNLRMPWSTEEMIQPKFLSVNQDLTARIRVALCVQAMLMWERWAQVCEIKNINSNSMRKEWSALMGLHEAMGYVVRGSQAFKRLSIVNLQQETSKIILP